MKLPERAWPPDLEACIALEIAYLQRPGFLPELWAAARRRGLPPEVIDYDMCHVFR